MVMNIMWMSLMIRVHNDGEHYVDVFNDYSAS